MNYIKGKVRQLIYEGNGGYKVGLFRVKETNDEIMNDFLNKTITFTGTFLDLNEDDTYCFYGEYIYHDRFGHQYKVDNYERILPTGHDALIEFLSSPLIKGCGTKTAIKIVDILGDDALLKIKENPAILSTVGGINEKKIASIYESLISYGESDEVLITLKAMGFSINEATTLINAFGTKITNIISTNIYSLIDYIPFSKLDTIYLEQLNNDKSLRIKACTLETMHRMSFNDGSTYYSFETILSGINKEFNLNVDDVTLDNAINDLVKEEAIVIIDKRIYLKQYYDEENEIAASLSRIKTRSASNINFENYINDIENEVGYSYNMAQKNAITSSLNNRISLITGGPGTGKTTIIRAICDIYISYHKLTSEQVLNDIALLAPTGRAAKKMSESTHLPAMTIHRYLKWNKENNEFMINEYNKNQHTLIIVDELSMLDTSLFASLLKGINTNVTLILVGDPHQLPSVGPGNILKELIDSNYFNYCPLTAIYRQTSNSYIPVLAEEIRNHDLNVNYTAKKDDYNFLDINSHQILPYLEEILNKSRQKGLTERDIQILAPMYRGENGIEMLNRHIRDIFNPDKKKNSIKIGDTIYREGDKVLQLINDTDNNVFNGDIGYIDYVDLKNNEVTINFYNNSVIYKREDLYNIKHAYVISIHKSQGSEFPHVILPISNNYRKMLYNKLIYTAVSRAKKSIVIIGDGASFKDAVNNDYSNNRETSLIHFLDAYFK